MRKLSTDNRFSEKFGSQYLYYDDEEQGAAGLDVVGPGTPMISRANDGWCVFLNVGKLVMQIVHIRASDIYSLFISGFFIQVLETINRSFEHLAVVKQDIQA